MGVYVYTLTASLLSWIKNCLHLKEIFTIFNLEYREEKKPFKHSAFTLRSVNTYDDQCTYGNLPYQGFS